MKTFPKIELHLHIDGSVPPATAWQLAKDQGLPEGELTLEEVTRRMVIQPGENGTDFKEFDLPLAVMQTAPALRQVTADLIARLAGEGVCYAELRFAPQFHLEKGLTQRDAIEAVLQGVADGEAACPEIAVGILLCAMGKLEPAEANRDENLETVRLAAEFIAAGSKVVGVDLAGYEEHLADYADIFDLARELGVPATCHSEFEVPQCLPFGTPRIGHGYQVAQRPDLAEIVKARGVTLEMCPVSSIISYDLPEDGRHPLKVLYDQGVKVTVNTDNLTVLGTSLEREYEYCRQMGFCDRDLILMNINSAEAAFLPPEEKAKLVARLRACLED
ncbi:adenosine deaminase [Acetanaerobacterium sp. MSJ-12]|uniref:adenosine deaminase n=1 Tax=Bittarella massiliensis (ex Durand et al. 2017) TaxID=1720313 RepID=A0AAW5KD40_9FIRM|nr:MULTISPECIES: adenosine deaminase [Oscillospiraceae]MBC2871736.1 adenosine deaminase [Bittarella massiliensis (ex Durand et al. 2017)]MBU5419894.1 adenosine deaminase [Acetanaerobacterium sp. MSJ-12]MCQ4949225.1 adenosine deaminase [Bittarella massiliensis (ex Durand et al. 2017)]